MIPVDTPRGTRVECIDDSNYQGINPNAVNSLPVKGRVYTVREIVNTERNKGVRLLEVQNPLTQAGDEEPAFALRRFKITLYVPRSKVY